MAVAGDLEAEGPLPLEELDDGLWYRVVMNVCLHTSSQ
jgi:hypothetical protein